jgi:hypothetical protein
MTFVLLESFIRILNCLNHLGIRDFALSAAILGMGSEDVFGGQLPHAGLATTLFLGRLGCWLLPGQLRGQKGLHSNSQTYLGIASRLVNRDVLGATVLGFGLAHVFTAKPTSATGQGWFGVLLLCCTTRRALAWSINAAGPLGRWAGYLG